MSEIFLYRHKHDKDVYLTRIYSCCGGSRADHFYCATRSISIALANTAKAYEDPFAFECHLKTPYRFGTADVDDTVSVTDTKEFEFDGYKGTASKTIKYHLKDFEKVIFVEKGETE